MSTLQPNGYRRLLVIDDTRAIHEDIRKILAAESTTSELQAMEAALFDEALGETEAAAFEIDSAYQGQEGLARVEEALRQDRPYAVAFVDVRMPPGWDGIETIERLWQVDPALQIVICTAYSDYSWSTISRKFGTIHRMLILKKPFDNIEMMQIAHALSQKWLLERHDQQRLNQLDTLVQARTQDLQAAKNQLEKQMQEREQMEMELRLAQKLEAVGQLAAGIAHEINTPIQYVGDSIHFLRSAFADLQTLLGGYQAACKTLAVQAGDQTTLVAMAAAEDAADLPYVQEEGPRAFERALDGVNRVAEIVRAMKEFGYQDQRTRSEADLNKALLNTLIVARNEYKYVAEVETALGELPPVPCHIGDLNQVFLNLIVNAAHAIGAVVTEGQEKGRIRIQSRTDGDWVEIAIEDTGCGIPAEISERVFDPFFTTKEPGKGTGQGLAIARSIVVDKHGGTLTFRSEPGRGTTFRIRLPIDGDAGSPRRG